MTIYLVSTSPHNEDFLLREGYATRTPEIAKIIRKDFEELFFVDPEVTIDMRSSIAYAKDPTDDFQKEYFIHKIEPVD